MWVTLSIGLFAIHTIADYVKQKCNQTLLDGLYIQLLNNWFLEGIMYMMVYTLLDLQLTSWTITWIFGWGMYLSYIFSVIHLICCLLYRISTIFFHDYIETLRVQRFLRFVRLVPLETILFSITYLIYNFTYVSYRIFEVVMVISVFLTLKKFQNSNRPLIFNIVHALETFQSNKVAAILSTILSLTFTGLKLLFKTIIYCKVAEEIHSFLSIRSVILLTFSGVVPLMFVGLNVMVQHYMIFFGLFIILRNLIIPLDILVSREEFLHHFRAENPKLLRIMSTMKCTVFRSKNVSPIDVIT